MIGPTIEIKGTVTGDEDLVIQGKVEGTVELGSHQVTVGQAGKVNADIQAKAERQKSETGHGHNPKADRPSQLLAESSPKPPNHNHQHSHNPEEGK